MFHSRLSLLSATLFLFFTAVSIRLFYWQIWKSSELKNKAIGQTYKLSKVNPIRGTIYTSDNYPIVQNQKNYLLSIYKPELTTTAPGIIEKINQIYPTFSAENETILNTFFADPQQKWTTLSTKFTASDSSKLKMPGLTFQPTFFRFYPEEDLAQQLLGRVTKDSNGNDLGMFGLEGYYHKQLAGKSGYYWQTQDATGNPILSSQNWKSTTIDGRHLHTSINRGLQYIVERELIDGINRFQADQGSIIIITPKTGQIIAFASVSSSPSAVKNRLPPISDLYEPGSIFKPLVVTAALDKKAITSDFICQQCNRPREIGNDIINNWNDELHPNSSLRDIIKNSDNIGMSFIIDELGLKDFLQYYHRLGLATKTGIDLAGEIQPPSKNNWPSIDLATASFGQGIAITQIQMLRAFNTIASDGQLVQPTIVDYFTEGTNTIPRQRQSPIRVFNHQAISQIKDILQYSVDNGVVAKFNTRNLPVCAKSGTAQVAIHGQYTSDQTIASYIGFAPCDNPKFSMIITIHNPKTSPWGASTAAPIWFSLAEKLYFLL